MITELDIFFPFAQYDYIGGPSTFMSNLKDYLDSKKINYLKSSEKAKAIFFPVVYDYNELKKIKKNNGKIIQRLDGIYYPEKHGDRHLELNRDIKEIYLNYSDFIIFQSQYSKRQCLAMLGEKEEKKYSIILNGVNKNIFYPSDKNSNTENEKFRIVTTGNFRNLDMLEPIIKALDMLDGSFNFELHIVGPIVNLELKKLLNRKNIIEYGLKNLYETSDILRYCDLFLYSHLNPPCPNSVIEAISCALPVVGFDSGSMRELLYFSKELLVPVKDVLFQKYEQFDSYLLAEKIFHAKKNYEQYKKLAVDNSELYSFDVCGESYLEVFKKIINY